MVKGDRGGGKPLRWRWAGRIPAMWAGIVTFDCVPPGLTRGPAFPDTQRMERESKGGWVYIMADRYRGTMYVGVTSNLAARIYQHRSGDGSDFCARYGLFRLVWAECGNDIVACIEHEKRLKRWRRQWKFDLIERGNPDWQDLSDLLA